MDKTFMRLSAALLAALGAMPVQGQAQDNSGQFPLPPASWPAPIMDQHITTFLLLDRFEYRVVKGDNARAMDAQAWIGGDYNKLWLKAEGEQLQGGPAEDADLQLLYARRILPFWHLQAGVRHEARPRPSRNSAVIAIEGLAPYGFEVEGSLFLRAGEVSGRIEAEFDQRLNQRLVLQPRIETNFASASERDRGVGSGINDVQLGLRLRYEIRREIAPYIGLSWTRKVGNTAHLARAADERVSERGVVIGMRLWY